MAIGGFKAVLILEDGSVAEGKSFGAKGSVTGEVVFSTAMTGYQEALTDPSYYGQILVQTFPLIGNYGVNGEDDEAEKTAVNGYIVRECCDEPSNFRATEKLDSFMKKNNIIGLYDIDTRMLTRRLREFGSMNGMITTEEYDLESVVARLKEHKLTNAVKSVVSAGCEYKAEKRHYSMVMLDFGHKKSFINEFLGRNCDISVLPYDTSADEILKLNPDGIILSSGPGDPSELLSSAETIKKLMAEKIPMLGIGLGHQLIASASGAKIQKLKQGHRGGNQPVIDLESGKTYITSQNHGYTVDKDSVDASVAEVNRVNANDKSCEGLKYREYPIISVEFYPQTLNIKNDTSHIFGEFISLVAAQKNKRS